MRVSEGKVHQAYPTSADFALLGVPARLGLHVLTHPPHQLLGGRTVLDGAVGQGALARVDHRVNDIHGLQQRLGSRAPFNRAVGEVAVECVRKSGNGMLLEL